MLHHRIACVLLIAFFAGSGAPASPPAERDLWYSITDGELRFGSMNLTVRQLDDGHFEYHVTSQLKFELLGTPQEATSVTRLVVSPDLSPLHLESHSTTLSGETRLQGRATENGFIIEFEDRAQQRISELVFDDETWIQFDLTMADWLHREAKNVAAAPAGEALTTRTVQLISAANGAVSETVIQLIEHGATGSTWTLETDSGPGSTTVRVGADGLLIEQSRHLPPMHMVRSSPEEARDIVYRRIPDRELLFFSIGRELPLMRRMQSMDVLLTWNSIPIEEFELEDSRQKIESMTEEEGRFAATVRLWRPNEDHPDTALPLPAEKFEASLAETDFITSADERIVRIARDLVGNEPSAYRAVTAICRWVSEYIEPTMIAETLSGSEVLERRTGKCSEYTTLFASIARAAGIPTRVALGVRRFNGSWGGHMWNEVFVGEWIPVDASANEVGGSLALLKFIHTDTVMATQPLRWKLTESLEISITDFELLPGAERGGAETGLLGGVYTNAEHGFVLQLPDEQWRIEETPQPGVLLVRLRPPGLEGDSVMIHLTAFEIPAGLAPKMLTDGRVSQQRAALDDFEMLLDEAVEIAGATGHRTRFGGVPKQGGGGGGAPLRVTEVLWISGESGTLLNMIATEELHEKYLATFEGLLSAFRYMDE